LLAQGSILQRNVFLTTENEKNETNRNQDCVRHGSKSLQSSLLNLHRALVHRNYRLLFSPKQRTKPGPKGPTKDLIRAVVEMKHRNPTWGCPQIEQINVAFGTSIPKDVVGKS
jgi:hypothetical protein